MAAGDWRSRDRSAERVRAMSGTRTCASAGRTRDRQIREIARRLSGAQVAGCTGMTHLHASLLCLVLAACSGTASTGAACPAIDPPTYRDFAQPFVAMYCAGCHSREARDRHGAPRGVDLDSEDDLRLHAADIDALAAKGPLATNTEMPDMSGPVRQAPSDAERARLGQFLACEAAR